MTLSACPLLEEASRFVPVEESTNMSDTPLYDEQFSQLLSPPLSNLTHLNLHSCGLEKMEVVILLSLCVFSENLVVAVLGDLG